MSRSSNITVTMEKTTTPGAVLLKNKRHGRFSKSVGNKPQTNKTIPYIKRSTIRSPILPPPPGCDKFDSRIIRLSYLDPFYPLTDAPEELTIRRPWNKNKFQILDVLYRVSWQWKAWLTFREIIDFTGIRYRGAVDVLRNLSDWGLIYVRYAREPVEGQRGLRKIKVYRIAKKGKKRYLKFLTQLAEPKYRPDTTMAYRLMTWRYQQLYSLALAKEEQRQERIKAFAEYLKEEAIRRGLIDDGSTPANP